MGRKRFSVTTDDANDGTLGVCLDCGEIRDGCEPDARGYECEGCGKHRVYGIEEALMMGAVDLEVDDEDDDDGFDDDTPPDDTGDGDDEDPKDDGSGIVVDPEGVESM